MKGSWRRSPRLNHKIELEAVAGTNPGGEIYAKVIGAAAAGSRLTRIRFTSVSPDLKVWVQQAAARQDEVPAVTS